MIGERVKPKEYSQGEETVQTHPSSAVAEVLPVCACVGLVIIFFKRGFSCNQNPAIEEVERDLNLQLPRKNTV